VILLGVISVSMASVLFKFATAEPLVVAFYRLALSVVLLAIPLVWRRDREKIDRRSLALSAVSGLSLAAHFAAWFFSLRLTSVASSTVLVSTHPFLVMIYARVAWGERTRGWALVGAGIAVIGVTLVGWGDFALDSRALTGDLLALVGAVAVSGYFLIGRHVRQKISAVLYSVTTYTTATLVLLAAALASGNPLSGFAPTNWAIFLALAVFPTIFGHTLFNWALKYVPASLVSVSILGEPVGASILAWLIWRTAPGPLSFAGGIFILLGIAMFQMYRHET
jgi:drug/metabolite transporter (DMT)-like permease